MAHTLFCNYEYLGNLYVFFGNVFLSTFFFVVRQTLRLEGNIYFCLHSRRHKHDVLHSNYGK